MRHVPAVVEKNLNVVAVNKMIIILKRIPENTREVDIVEYLTPVLNGKIFQKSGSIQYIQIQMLKNETTSLVENYGLVCIDSDEAANRAIKKLNRKAFKGKHIAIAEFHYRSWENDPRIGRNEPYEALGQKKRIDRRKSNLQKKEQMDINFSSHESFHRKL